MFKTISNKPQHAGWPRRAGRVVVLAGAVFASLTSIGVSQSLLAQDEPVDDPLLIRTTDLAAWYPGEEETFGLPYCDVNTFTTTPVPSPAGSWFAIQAAPPEEGSDRNAVAAIDLWLCNTQRQTSVQLSEQDAELGEVIVAGVPSWSPDGTQVAWVEFNATNSTQRLLAYDVEAEAVVELTSDLPLGGNSAVSTHWGQTGILVYGYGWPEPQLFSPNGERIEAILPAIERVVDFQWVQDESGNEYLWQLSLARSQPDDLSQVALWDVETGLDYQFSSGIEMISAYATQRGEMAVGVTFEGIEQNGTTIGWEVYVRTLEGELEGPLTQFTLGTPTDTPFVALSPDGQRVAFGPSEGRLWQDGEISQIPGAFLTEGMGMYWGAVVYIARGERTEARG